MVSLRKKIVLAVLAVVVVSGGILAYTQIGSGGSANANATVIYSKVEARTLQDTTVLSGTLGHKSLTTVAAQTPGFVSAVNATDNMLANSGDSLFALNGRDAIAEPGSIPFFRSLVPGDVGADVRELQQILASSGDSPGAVNGSFTQQTQAALARWQDQHHYPSATPASPESVTVALQQGTGYNVGAQSTAGLVIGPGGGALAGAASQGASGPKGAPARHRHSRPRHSHRHIAHVGGPLLSISGPTSISPNGQAQITVSASVAPVGAIDVSLLVAGTAQAGVDYVPFNPVLVLQSGTFSTSVTINALNDTTIGTPRYLDITLETPTDASYTVSEPSTQTLTFTGQTGAPTAPTVTLSSATTYLTKGAPFPVMIGLNQATTTNLQIALAYSGTAVEGTDFVPPAGNVVVPAGQTQIQVSIPTVSNNLVEPDTTLTVSLAANGNYTIGSPSSASVTIHDPNVPEMSISGSTVINPGGTATVTVSASQPPNVAVQVPLSLTGSAQPGTDYVPPDPVVTIPAGAESASLTIQSLINQVVEPTRYIVVSIAQSPSAAYTVNSPGNAVITINGATPLSAPPIVTLSSSTAYLHKGSPWTVMVGTNEALPSGLPIVLSYSGTAVAGRDFVPPTGQITVPAGQTALQIAIPTVADNNVEADTSLTVSLAPSPAYQVGSPSASTVTITSTVVPTITISSNTGTLGEGGSATFTITADQAPVKNTSVNFQVLGTAQPGQDYVPLAGTVLLPAGQTQVTVSFQSIQKDVEFEPTDMIVGNWPIRIGQVYVKQGNTVTTGNPILDLTVPDVTVTLQASPSDFTKLALGQSCTMTIAGGQTELSGTISELDTNPTVQSSGGGSSSSGSSEVFEGQIEVSDLSAGDANADGATVSITVVTQQATDATAVPIAAVKQNGVGQTVVRVIDLAHHGRITEVPVTTGLTQGAYVQVSGDLHIGQTVVVTIDQSHA